MLGLSLRNTTHAATASLPCILELSKHSIVIGIFSRWSASCISFIKRVAFCSGFSLSSCFIRSALYCFTFNLDSASRRAFSPFCGTVTVAPSIGNSSGNGNTISLALLPNLSRNSIMPIRINSSSLSSSLFWYSIVKAWFMQPLVMCRKLMNALFSSLSIENTSRFVMDELTTSLRVLNPSISWYLFLISSAFSNSRFIAFSFISSRSFSCRIFISPFRIELTSSMYL